MLYLPGEEDAPAAAGVADMVANPVSIWEIDSQVWRQTALAIAYIIVIVYCANITVETTFCHMLYIVYILTGRCRGSRCRGSGRHGPWPCKYRDIDSQVWRQTTLAIAYLIVIVYCANITVETTFCHMLYLPGEDDAPAAAGVADMVANPVSIWEIDSQVWRQTALAIAYLIVIVYCANITVE